MGHCHTPRLPWLYMKAAFGPYIGWLLGTVCICSCKVLPSSCQCFPSLIREKESSYWQGRQALCRGASSVSLCSRSQSGTEKNMNACCSPAPFIQAHEATERRSCKTRLNSLSDTHYFITVFPFHFWEIYTVVVWLRLQFLSFFILVFIKKRKEKKEKKNTQVRV